jgi:DNA-directed RNA polymerase subunit K/omega
MSKNKKVIIKEETEEDLSEIVNEEDDEIYEDEDENIEYTAEEYENDEEEVDEECLIEKLMEEDGFDSEINNSYEQKIVKKEDRISQNRLTKYEMVRILGERTKQLTMGAKPLVKNYESLSYDRIAEEELKLNMIPFKIKRKIPNGNYEIWTLDELYKDHLLSQLD